MAISGVKITLGADLGEGRFNSSQSFPVPATADATAFEAALAVLVADGASPTQAHVTTANNAYTTYKAAVTAYNSATSGDLVLLIDTAVVTTSNAVKWIVQKALQAAKNIGIVTP